MPIKYSLSAIILSCCLVADCAKILFIPAPAASSHKKSMMPLAEKLGSRGHNVTLWMPWLREAPSTRLPSFANVRDVEPRYSPGDRNLLEIMVYKNSSSAMNFWKYPSMKSHHMLLPWRMGSILCHEIVKNLNSTMHALAAETWDMIVMDAFFATCAYGIVETSGASFILQSTTVLYPHHKRNLAIPKPINAHMVNQVDFDVTKFWDRLSAVIFNDIIDVFCEQVINGMINYVLRSEWLPHRWHRLDQFEPEADFVFDMSPHSISFPMPQIPILSMIGDTPCDVLDIDLPLTYKSFIENADSKGTIVASFGHMISWKSAPDYVITSFQSAFTQLASEGYRIIWQYNGPPLDDLPDAVMAVNWLPQIALLNHYKTKVFISHCGLKSVMEVICSKVPVLAFPFFAEQHFNAQLLTSHHGAGMYLDKMTITSVELHATLKRLLANYEMHQANLIRLRSIMEDKLVLDVDIGAFWTEFAIKHSDQMAILKPRGQKLKFLEYFCLDVIGVCMLSCLVLTAGFGLLLCS